MRDPRRAPRATPNIGTLGTAPTSPFRPSDHPTPTMPEPPITPPSTPPAPFSGASISDDALTNWFTYHPPTPEALVAYQAVRSAGLDGLTRAVIDITQTARRLRFEISHCLPFAFPRGHKGNPELWMPRQQTDQLTADMAAGADQTDAVNAVGGVHDGSCSWKLAGLPRQ